MSKFAIHWILHNVSNLKKLEKSENLPEDLVKDNQDKIQKLTDKYIENIDKNIL